MAKFLKIRPEVWKRGSRSLSALVCTLYPAGREALLRRANARTALEELAVEQKRLEINVTRANKVLDLVQKVEKIKDPQLRARARAAILASGHILPPQDGAAA